jgi:hypothetical protein
VKSISILIGSGGIKMRTWGVFSFMNGRVADGLITAGQTRMLNDKAPTKSSERGGFTKD